MRLLFWIWIACFTITLWCLGWPGDAFTLPATFWFVAGLFAFFLDTAPNDFGSLSSRFRRRPPQ